MKAYHLMLSSANEEASPLHFVDRSDASRYQKLMLWPWESLGYFMTPQGTKVALAGAQFRVEPVSMPAFYDADLDWVLWRIDTILGFVPMVPGRCFDPSSWRSVSDQDRRDPIMAPKIAHAERELDASQNL